MLPPPKDRRFNNFPVSWAARYGSVIPLGQDFIEHDLHRLVEVRRIRPPGLVHLVQDVHRHLQPRRGLGLLHQPLHQLDGVEVSIPIRSTSRGKSSLNKYWLAL